MAYSAILFLSLFLLLPILAMANIPLNSSLFANGDNSLWLSPSGEFAFGFYQLTNTTLFLLAIWFAKIPNKTIVWHANATDPVPRGSKVELTANGLSLTDPGGETLWTQGGPATVSYAAMLDTGNFVLARDGSVYVWESFKNPTDTILPTQTLDLGSMLFSRLSQTNYSKGRFELHFFSNGILQLNPIGWPGEYQYEPYYTFPTSNANSSGSGIQLIFNESMMSIYMVTRNGGIVPLFSSNDDNSSIANNYYRATLDFNGVFTQYSHPRNPNIGIQSWAIRQYVPENICNATNGILGSGACGYNSYCSMKSDRPLCTCPPGYSFIDPIDEFGGCKLNFPQGCDLDYGSRDPEEIFDMMELQSVNWLGNYEWLAPFNQSECMKSCLHDCSCAVATFVGSNCWKKKLPLANGILNDTRAITALIKVSKGVPPGNTAGPISGTKTGKLILLGSLFFGSSVFLLLVAISLVLFSRHKAKFKNAVHDSSASKTNLYLFTYNELEEATDGFNEELGRGSFGIVYKGVLKFGSRNLVAVKKLDRLAQDGEKEFRTEVSAVGQTHHKNLVQLLGFCDEGTHRLLVYEFMSNGTVANFLFGLERPDWNQRATIALGIARGLVYLHEECEAPIIHCDIKPQNILLDDNFNARVADFGLAKLLLFDQTRTHTGIRGTKGYVAPEWFKNVPVTVKVDVYSFGVMLLEIICSRKSVAMEFGEEGRAILTDWAYDCYTEGRLDELVENDEMAMGDIGKLQRWVMIAIWCIQEDPSKRPTMKIVKQMLEGLVEVPVPPCPSSFS